MLDQSERNKAIFTLYRNENPNVIVSVYPSLEANTYKDDVFLSYYFDIKIFKQIMKRFMHITEWW